MPHPQSHPPEEAPGASKVVAVVLTKNSSLPPTRAVSLAGKALGVSPSGDTGSIPVRRAIVKADKDRQGSADSYALLIE